MNLDRATELAQTTDYAHEAVEEDNPINWADAGAFFLEGYLYAQQHRGKTQCDERRAAAMECAVIAESDSFPSYEELEAKLWMAEHERDELKRQLANPLHEYICVKCGLRQNSNSEIPNF